MGSPPMPVSATGPDGWRRPSWCWRSSVPAPERSVRRPTGDFCRFYRTSGSWYASPVMLTIRASVVRPVRVLPAILALLLAVAPNGRAAFTTFESGQVRPLALSPDGGRLFAVNTPDGRLEIFDVGAG